MVSNSEYSFSEDDEETDFDVEIEDVDENQVEGAAALVQPLQSVQISLQDFDEDDDEPYAGEPLANQVWLENYNRRRARAEQQEHFLNSRLNSIVTVDSW
eukprot:Seg4802.4 transcript_id=Seg4802.4/GoldUCD/mRNA.D3Y31 product="hypothetical protein" protein_id=Seg4802.4/GoldUCD/D3Y31